MTDVLFALAIVAPAGAQGTPQQQEVRRSDPGWEQSALGAVSGQDSTSVVQFELTRAGEPIGSASLRVYAAALGGVATDVGVYAADNGGPTGAVRLGQRLAVVRVRAGDPAWYDWDVSAYVAGQAAAGRSPVRFALRGPSGGTQALRLAGTDQENRPELRTVRCTPQRCPARLGVFVGNDAQRVGQFEAWLGRPVDAVLAFTGHQSWDDFDGSLAWALGLWSPIERPILWSIPLFPRGGELERAAAGDYDRHYEKAARQLARFRPSDRVVYVRTAWEWNGDWFPWFVTKPSQIPTFVAAFRHFVEVFRRVSPRFAFDWCPSIGRVNFPWEQAYPGNAYVDVIGMDIYDETRWSAIADPRARFVFERTRDHGLDWLAGFAARMHKPISLAEWGMGGDGSGDDATFIERMHDWIATHPVVYQAYWNSNASYPGELSGGQYKAAASAYRARFGAAAQPSRSRSSLRSSLRSKSPSQ